MTKRSKPVKNRKWKPLTRHKLFYKWNKRNRRHFEHSKKLKRKDRDTLRTYYLKRRAQEVKSKNRVDVK